MNKIYAYILSRLNPLKHAKKIGVNVGENVHFTARVSWGSEPYLINIGDNTKFSQNVVFTNHDGAVNVLRNLYDIKDADIVKPIKIGKNCFIGINVTILFGTNIGDNVIVGAGSIVTSDLESNSVYAGVPAKRICSIEEYYEKNKKYLLPTKNMNPKQKKEFLIKKYYENK